MKPINKLLGIGALCAALAIPYFVNRHEEDVAAVVTKSNTAPSESVLLPAPVTSVTDEATGEVYRVKKGELYGPHGEIISARGNCIMAAQRVMPYGMRICSYSNDQRMSVDVFSESGRTRILDGLVGSDKMKPYNEMFDRNRGLLRKAGLMD